MARIDFRAREAKMSAKIKSAKINTCLKKNVNVRDKHLRPKENKAFFPAHRVTKINVMRAAAKIYIFFWHALPYIAFIYVVQHFKT